MGHYFSRLWDFLFPFRQEIEQPGFDNPGNERAVTVCLESSPLFTVMVVYYKPGEMKPRSEVLPLNPLQSVLKIKDFLSGLFNIPVQHIELSSLEGKLKDDLTLHEQNVQHDSCLMLTDKRTM